MTEPKTVGERIRSLRKEKDIGAIELAMKAGLSRNMIWQVETGRSNPSLESLARIAAALGVTAAELLEEGSDDVAAW